MQPADAKYQQTTTKYPVRMIVKKNCVELQTTAEVMGKVRETEAQEETIPPH
jgi:hypothetical protein